MTRLDLKLKADIERMEADRQELQDCGESTKAINKKIDKAVLRLKRVCDKLVALERKVPAKVPAIPIYKGLVKGKRFHRCDRRPAVRVVVEGNTVNQQRKREGQW